jgi:molybdopterin/thiamine biosynthesis adenylyltransferase
MAPKPLFKVTNPPYVVNDSVLVQQSGSLLEIEDPDRAVRELVALLDGTRTIDEIDQAFRQQRPGSDFDVRSAIVQFDEAGLIEDADAPSTLNADELERWKRNLGFFETYASLSRNKYAMQERVRDCKVTLLGLGGVGSYVSLTLLGCGVRDLLVVDFDKVELSNLNRQILYSEDAIGQRKIDVAVSRLQGYNRDARITAVEQMLTSAADIENVVTGRDFVFCMIDRPKMHVIRWLNEACVRAGVPFVGGGIELQRSMIYLVIPGVTGCIECWQRASANDENTRALRAQMEERHSTNSGVGPDLSAFGPLVSVLNSLMTSEFIRFVTGIAPPIAAGRLVETRFDSLTIATAEQWDRLPDCPVCRDIAPISSTR